MGNFDDAVRAAQAETHRPQIEALVCPHCHEYNRPNATYVEPTPTGLYCSVCSKTSPRPKPEPA